jgi:Skp family chaperone for outer membrane proteins
MRTSPQQYYSLPSSSSINSSVLRSTLDFRSKYSSSHPKYKLVYNLSFDTMMKAIITSSLLVLLLFTTALPSSTFGFVPAGTRVRAAHSKKPVLQNIMRDDIAQELQHLGTEIKKHVMHKQPAADSSVDEDTSSASQHLAQEESTIHKLRNEMRERDVQYRSMLQGLQDAVAGLAIILETEANTLQAEEKVMERDIEIYEEEHESVRSLLAQAGKLMIRRITKPIYAVLYFLRLKKKKK